VLLALLLLNDDRSLKVQIVLFFKNVEERRVGATINSNLLELVSKMVFDGLLFESITRKDDVVFSF